MIKVKITFSDPKEKLIAEAMKNAILRFLPEMNIQDENVTIQDTNKKELQVPLFMRDLVDYEKGENEDGC